MDKLYKYKKVPIVLLGNTIYALAVTVFIVPNGLITGGTTGLALFFQYQFQIPISLFVSCFNVIMFVLGAFFLGKKFALTTLISSFYFPFILSVFQGMPQLGQLTSNTLLAALYAGGMIGVGMGMVLREGASTGGLDIPPLILNKKFGLSISVVMYAIDFCILLLQIVISDSERVLYGILVVLVYTIVLGKVLVSGKGQTRVEIVSEQHEAINEMIQGTLDRGSTLMKAVTGHYRRDTLVIFTVIANRELPRLNQLVKEIDPDAFITINQVSEVRGRGFTMEKRYRQISDVEHK